jgi:hypothetical protein
MPTHLSDLPCALVAEVFGYLTESSDRIALRATCVATVTAFDDGVENSTCGGNAVIYARGDPRDTPCPHAPFPQSATGLRAWWCPISRVRGTARFDALYVSSPAMLRWDGSKASFPVVVLDVDVLPPLWFQRCSIAVLECRRGAPLYGSPAKPLFPEPDCCQGKVVRVSVWSEQFGCVTVQHPTAAAAPVSGHARDTVHETALVAFSSKVLPHRSTFASHHEALKTLLENEQYSITYFDVRRSAAFSNQDVERIAAASPGLTHLCLADTSHLSGQAIRAICRYSASTLRHIDVRDCHGVLADAWVQLLRAAGPSLRVAHLGPAVTDAVVDIVATLCSHLETLSLSSVRGLSPESWARVNLPYLAQLTLHDVSMVPDSAIAAIAQRCTRLTDVDLTATRIGDDAVVALARHRGADLRVLRLGGCQVTATSLQGVAASCTKLRDLSLEGASIAADIVIAIIAATGGALTRLDVSTSPCVDDGLFAMIGKCCPHLLTLEAAGSRDLTNEGVAAVARGCPALTHVNLSNCTRLESAALVALATACTSLEHVDMSHVRGSQSDDAVAALAANCPRLRHVNLFEGTYSSRSATVVHLVRRCPRLRYLNMTPTYGPLHLQHERQECLMLFSR